MELRTLSRSIGAGAAVLLAGVLAGNPNHPVPVKTTRISLRRHHGPVKVLRRRDQTVSETHNWSGYAVTTANGAVNAVSGSWVIPQASCSAALSDSNGYAAFWVGIDGWSSNTVEQIGTDSDCVNLSGTQTNTPTYYAWFEFYPQDAYLIGSYTEAGVCRSGCVHPGDSMEAQVSYGGSAARGPGRHGSQQFTVTITDLTQNWSFTISSSVPGAQQSSAEWIAETPYGCNTPANGDFCPLADFNTVTFSNSSATVGSTAQPVAQFGNSVQEAIIVGEPSGVLMAEPGSLAGGDFSVNWYSAGP